VSYAHSPGIHFGAPALGLFFGWLAVRIAGDPALRGGMAVRILLAGSCGLLAVFALGLYLKTGLARYEVQDDGLLIRQPWGRRLVPWTEIVRIDWNEPLSYVVIRARSGVVAFTSTDAFPRLFELLAEVGARSRCAVAPPLAYELVSFLDENDESPHS
jgi:Bacterial PH domain